MASTISAGTTSGTAIAIAGDTSGALALQTNNGTTAVTIDTSQNVGIGTTSPSTKLQVNSTADCITVQTSAIAGYANVNYNNTAGTQMFGVGYANTSASVAAGTGYVYTGGATPITFWTNASERMRIDSSGNAMVGTTGTTSRFEVYKSDSVGQCVVSINNPDAQGTGTRISFKQSSEQAYFSSLYSGGWNLYARSGSSGGVVLAQNATSWTSTSDVRLKNVTGTYTNALSDIAKIEPIKFTWKNDSENTPQVGVTAQSVKDVVPEAITLCKMSEDDETEYYGVRYTELIPLLTAAIQELNTKVEAQAATIATLQAKVGA